MVYGSAEARPAARGARFWLSVTGGKYFHQLALLGLGNFIVDNVPTWFAGGAEGSPYGIVADHVGNVPRGSQSTLWQEFTEGGVFRAKRWIGDTGGYQRCHLDDSSDLYIIVL
jgi:hypothetical protein